MNIDPDDVDFHFSYVYTVDQAVSLMVGLSLPADHTPTLKDCRRGATWAYRLNELMGEAEEDYESAKNELEYLADKNSIPGQAKVKELEKEIAAKDVHFQEAYERLLQGIRFNHQVMNELEKIKSGKDSLLVVSGELPSDLEDARITCSSFDEWIKKMSITPTEQLSPDRNESKSTSGSSLDHRRTQITVYLMAKAIATLMTKVKENSINPHSCTKPIINPDGTINIKCVLDQIDSEDLTAQSNTKIRERIKDAFTNITDEG